MASRLAQVIDDRARAAFLEAYAGPIDPADALWWLEHPDDPSPAGEVPLVRRLEEARRAVFVPAPEPESSERYRQLAATVVDNDRATQAALRIALASEPEMESGELPETAIVHDQPRGLSRAVVLTAAVMLGVGLLVGLGIGRASSAGPVGQQLVPSATTSPLIVPAVTLADPTAPGTTLLRMSDSSPQVGGSLPESGTSAYESSLISRPTGRIRLTATCTGGDGLLIVPGSNGLVDDNYLSLDCPVGRTTTVRTFLAATATAAPFHLVVYEREPVTWKLLLSEGP